MNKCISRIWFCTIIVLVFQYIFLIINVNAWDIDIDQTLNPGDESSWNEGVDMAKKEANSIISNFILVFQVIGVGIAIIMLISLGAKYMMGSIEQKAEIKKHAVVYVVGAVIFFGAFGILTIIQEFIKGNFKVEV